jgi:hypothetical protein
MNTNKLLTFFAVVLFFVLASLTNKIFTVEDNIGNKENYPKVFVNDKSITQTYSADLTSVFPNPERGWHNRRDIDGRGGDDDRDFSDVVAAGHTWMKFRKV